MSFLDSSVVPGSRYWYRLRVRNQDGSEETLRAIDILVPRSRGRAASLDPPAELAPGGPIEIRFRIAGARIPIQLDIFDVRGRRLRALDQSLREPGEHSVRWNRRSDAGLRVPRGTYFLRLEAAGLHADTRKLVLRHQ